MRRACDCVQDGCFQLWLRIQKNKEAAAQGERCRGEAAGSRTRVSQGGENMQTEVLVEACWRQLVENLEEWWDNRVTRSNPRAPDFKHKRTRRALWIDNWQTREWAQARFGG